MPSTQIKDEKTYKELRKDGASKEKAARISNAAAKKGRSAVGRKGGQSGDYDDWTVEHPRIGGLAWRLGIQSDLQRLYDAAAEIGRQPAGARARSLS